MMIVKKCSDSPATQMLYYRTIRSIQQREESKHYSIYESFTL